MERAGSAELTFMNKRAALCQRKEDGGQWGGEGEAVSSSHVLVQMQLLVCPTTS